MNTPSNQPLYEQEGSDAGRHTEIVAYDASEKAFQMLSIEGHGTHYLVHTALNNYARKYIAKKTERQQQLIARELRPPINRLRGSLEKTCDAIDDLPAESFEILAKGFASDFAKLSDRDDGKSRMSNIMREIVEFTEHVGQHVNVERDPKGPTPRPELNSLVEKLLDLYEMLIEEPPTHSVTKASVYEGAPQSHAGRYVHLVVQAIDPEIPPSRVSRALSVCLAARRDA